MCNLACVVLFILPGRVGEYDLGTEEQGTLTGTLTSWAVGGGWLLARVYVALVDKYSPGTRRRRGGCYPLFWCVLFWLVVGLHIPVLEATRHPHPIIDAFLPDRSVGAPQTCSTISAGHILGMSASMGQYWAHSLRCCQYPTCCAASPAE
jgi:hypothetical protein